MWQHPNSTDTERKIKETEKELDEMLYMEEIMSCQRSRIMWLK